MKTTDLVNGQYYRIEYEKDFWAIFRFDNRIQDDERVELCLSISNDWNNNNGGKIIFDKISWYLGKGRKVTLASKLEKQWLLACIKAGKLVEKPININYEIY